MRALPERLSASHLAPKHATVYKAKQNVQYAIIMSLSCVCLTVSLLFASVVGLLGNMGSSSHGSACAYLLSLAQLEVASGRMSHSLATPPTLGEAGSAEVSSP